MIKNYLKVALRNILKHKAYSFINIVGLTIGMAACILILLWVQYELSYDNFHANSDNIYRVLHEWTNEGETSWSSMTQVPLAPALKAQCPQIKYATRFDGGDRQIIEYLDKRLESEIVAEADNDFLKMFSLEFLKGDSRTALVDPFSVVISLKTADKFFGNADPLGKILNIDRRDFTVTGVFENIPQNSHFGFDCIVPFESRRDWLKELTDSWYVSAYFTYLLTESGADIDLLENRVTAVMLEHVPDSTSALHLQPLEKIHLHSSGLEFSQYGDNQPGSIDLIYIFLGIAFLILIIACINYMNITTARYSLRAKEIGLRKAIGALSNDIRWQFMAESILLTIAAMVMALVLVELASPYLSAWYGKKISLSLLQNPSWIFYLAGVTLATGFLAGSYPAFFLASFAPIRALGKSPAPGKSNAMIRKGLVVFQFSISISLIIVSSIAFSQINHMIRGDLGFDQENLLYVNMRGAFADDYQNIKNELLDYPGVVSVSAGWPPKSLHWASNEVDWDGKNPDKRVVMCRYNVDFGYVDVMGMNVIRGRDFDSRYSTDAAGAFILNQEAVKLMGIDDVIGKRFAFEGREGVIIGVIKDFHNQSFHEPVYPLVLQINPEELHYLLVRVKPENIAGLLSFLKDRWHETSGEFIFEYSFMDETIASFYTSEIKMAAIFKLATGLAIFISCLGLFGLAVFTAEKRTKEIGIRKVLGATHSSIVRLLSGEFIILILAANIIAWPAAYFVMSRWLESYAYRVPISWIIFIAAGIGALGFGLLTISIQTMKATFKNPVEAIRYE